MLDAKGKPIRLGDRVSLGGGIAGAVIFSIDTDEFSPEFPKDQSNYLGHRVTVLTECAGLVYIDENALQTSKVSIERRIETRSPRRPVLGVGEDIVRARWG